MKAKPIASRPTASSASVDGAPAPCDDSATQCTCEDTQLPKWKEAAKGKLKTVAYDTLPFELDLLKAGKVHGLVGQKYWGWGYDTVTMLRDRIIDKKQFEAFTDSGIDLVCANNVAQMSALWASNNFTQPLDACSQHE